MQKHRAFWRRARDFVASPKFFWGLVGFFVLEAAWIAVTARYPMAFDEDFHLGIIRLYAQHWGPFWGGQPESADAFGAVARDPSYLYHFLMSFPYRFIRLFTDDTTIQVLWLRAINIALFAAGLPLYRRLLARTGASQAIINACLAVFVLIPIVPLLAAQINYDNLILPVTAATLLLALKVTDRLRDKKQLDLPAAGYLLSILLLGSLIKYAFLPIALAVGLFVLFQIWRAFPNLRQLVKQLKRSLKGLSMRSRWLLAALLVLSLGLFSERYMINLVRYHAPVPTCDQVLTVEQCSEYGPWNRDYNLAQTKQLSLRTHNPIRYTGSWFYGMWLRSFFAVDGPTTRFQTRGPLVLPGLGAVLFASIAGLAVVLKGWSLRRKYSVHALSLFTVVTLCYIGVLWVDEYREFLHTGRPVAINGRYLLPVLPMILVIGALSLNELFGKWQKLKLAFASAVIISLLWGGGALTYILRSNDAWYWPGVPQVIYDVNHAIQQVVSPYVPGHEHPTQFLH